MRQTGGTGKVYPKTTKCPKTNNIRRLIIYCVLFQPRHKDLQLPHPCSPTCSPRSDFRICEMIALGLVTSRLDYCNSLLYMALQRRTSADSSVSRTISRDCASSCMELQFKTIVQTLTLASSPAEDDIQDRSRNIQSANFRTAILSPQSAGQPHTFT